MEVTKASETAKTTDSATPIRSGERHSGGSGVNGGRRERVFERRKRKTREPDALCRANLLLMLPTGERRRGRIGGADPSHERP